jgi:complex III assembly factor LYRM7
MLGDMRLLHAARQTARQKFNSLRALAPQSQEATAGIAHAQEVARVLKMNVVQGMKVEEGKYRE